MAPKFAPFLGDIARMQENLSKNKSNVEHFIEDAIAEPEVDLRLVQYGPLSIINT